VLYPGQLFQEELFVLEDDSSWSCLSEGHRVCANTASFSIPSFGGTVFDVHDLVTPLDVSQALALDVEFEPEEEHMAGWCAEEKAQYKVWAASRNKTRSGPRLSAKARLLRAKKEASATDQRQYAKQFAEAKQAEYQSWRDNEVFDLVDMRKHPAKNFVTGRWVLTIKRDKDGKFTKCKARWVLRGFQDKQKLEQQTDSPTATRPGFRLTCQVAANRQLCVSYGP
jgi:hypothetical protein